MLRLWIVMWTAKLFAVPIKIRDDFWLGASLRQPASSRGLCSNGSPLESGQ